MHIVIATFANVHVIKATRKLLHDEETDVSADAGYQGIKKRDQARPAQWHVVMRPGKRRKLKRKYLVKAIYDQIERLKASPRAKDGTSVPSLDDSSDI